MKFLIFCLFFEIQVESEQFVIVHQKIWATIAIMYKTKVTKWSTVHAFTLVTQMDAITVQQSPFQ